MSTITFHNQSWKKGVNVEVHFGDDDKPNVNSSIGIRQIAYQEDWRVSCSAAILQYRRDRNPDNPEGQMTGWTTVQHLGTDLIENI